MTALDSDLSDRLEFDVDAEAVAVDLDDVLADFLISLYERPTMTRPQDAGGEKRPR